MSRGVIQLSLVVPCYNEEGNVFPFYNAVRECLEPIDIDYEIIFVDDGSKDDTLSKLRQVSRMAHCDGGGRVQVLSFSRNFGKESAILAGLKASSGEIIGFIDADMQQDPQVALELYKYLRDHAECDIAAARQVSRKEGLVTRAFKGAFYRLFSAMSNDVDIPADVSDFRLFRRCVADALLSMPEYYRFSKGLFAWVGFNLHCIPYEPRLRNSGKSTWGFRGLVRYALDGMMSFSTRPLRLATWLGLLSSALALLYLTYVVFVDYLVFGVAIPGYPTLVCLMLLFGGVQLLIMGILGEYLARSYIEGKRRPHYFIRRVYDSRELLDD